MRFTVRIDDTEIAATIQKNGELYAIELDGKPYAVDCVYFGDTGYLSLLIDNASYLIESAPTKPEDGRYYARVMGKHYDVEVLDELLVAAREANAVSEKTGAHSIIAPMPGLIVSVEAVVGDTVKAGDAIVIMEAMKMQNVLTTDVSGVITAVHVTPHDAVDSQANLVTIEIENDIKE